MEAQLFLILQRAEPGKQLEMAVQVRRRHIDLPGQRLHPHGDFIVLPYPVDRLNILIVLCAWRIQLPQDFSMWAYEQKIMQLAKHHGGAKRYLFGLFMKFKKTEEQQAPCVRQSPLRETLYKVAGGAASHTPEAPALFHLSGGPAARSGWLCEIG